MYMEFVAESGRSVPVCVTKRSRLGITGDLEKKRVSHRHWIAQPKRAK